ncbi:hypothetical protein B566_EDAN015585 [Ephemera danica]|nr:hypothetical protein B566_EDAN015585 [Ephemera danica]
MEVEQEETLGNVSEGSLQQQEPCTPPCRPLAGECLNAIESVPKKIQETPVKVDTLKRYLECDMTAVDVKLSLFVASAMSYRFDSCLKPFPPQYIEGLDKNIDKLRDIISQIPTMPQLLKQLHDQTLNIEVIDLLYWILEEQEPKLMVTNKTEFEAALNLAPSNMKVKNPSFIFQVANKWSDVSESRWQQMVSQYGTLHAYHGSKLENFHSILRYGLQQHLNKNGLFGSGIYLSSELGVSLPYSLTGCGWSLSGLGSQLSCVALCEAINHPDVKCQQTGVPREVARSRALSRDSIGGEVPEKYYLVCNSDLGASQFLVQQRYVHLDSQTQDGAPCVCIRRASTCHRPRQQPQQSASFEKSSPLSWSLVLSMIDLSGDICTPSLAAI